jgi:hexosaminidase
MEPVLGGVFDNIGLMAGDEHFGYRFNGYIDVPETGIYTFTLGVHGMANLYIDGQRIIDCDGPHGYWDKEADEADCWYKYGRVALKKGKHAIRIDYRNHHGQHNLKLLWQAESGEREPVPDSAFSHGGSVKR